MGDHLRNTQSYENWSSEPWLQVPSPNSWPKPPSNNYAPSPYIWGGEQISDIEGLQHEEVQDPLTSAVSPLSDTWSNTWGQTGTTALKNPKLNFKKAGSWTDTTSIVPQQLPMKTIVEKKKEIELPPELTDEELITEALAEVDLADKKKKKNTIEEELSKQSLYKTELCRSYQETGICRYGHKCQFAHGEHELRPILRHPKYKTEYCQRYAMFGHCPYGNRCRFIHPDRFKNRSHSSPDPTMKKSLADPAKLPLDLHKSADFSSSASYAHSEGWSSNWNSQAQVDPSFSASPRVAPTLQVPEPLAPAPSANQTIQPELFLHPWALNRRASSESSLLTSMPPVMKPPTSSFVERPSSSEAEGRRLNIFQSLSTGL